MPTVIDKLSWFLVRDRKVLYVRSKGKDIFFNPGGKREGNETDIETLAREIKEELSVDIIPETARYLVTLRAQAAGKPEGVLMDAKCYSADYTGTLTPSSEIEELAWFTSADGHRTSAMGRLILEWLKKEDLID